MHVVAGTPSRENEAQVTGTAGRPGPEAQGAYGGLHWQPVLVSAGDWATRVGFSAGAEVVLFGTLRTRRPVAVGPARHSGMHMIRHLRARLRARFATLRHGQDGNGLILMPAGVLILFFLASLAADTSVRWRAQTALESEAPGLANDAASAIDEADWFDTGTAVPSHTRTADIMARSDRCTGNLIPGSTPPQVGVECTDTYDWLFRPGTFTATGTARAELLDG